MADITVTRSHTLEPAELRSRLERLSDEMVRKFGLTRRWEGDTCHLSGPAVKRCVVSMGAGSVSLELTLGLMARMLKGQIEKEIDSRLQKLLA